MFSSGVMSVRKTLWLSATQLMSGLLIKAFVV